MPITAEKAPDTLPDAAKKIFVAAFNNAYGGDCDDQCASKIAWSAVKDSYKKNADGMWVAMSGAVDGEANTSAAPVTLDSTNVQGTSQEDVGLPVAQFSMFVTKATTVGGGVRKWAATASDTMKDSYNTVMSKELFENFIEHIENGDQLPVELQSEVLEGGMPFLGVAHYGALGGMGIVGPATKLAVDGNQFKARGLFDNPKNPDLVDKSYAAIRSDIEQNKPDNERARISIAFYDMEHIHGQSRFVRRSYTDRCPICVTGSRPDTYVDGMILHLALTRVPVNKRTGVEAWEERSDVSIETRKDDAASIVGEEAAAELDELQRSSVHRSENVATFSDVNPVPVKSESDGYYGGALTISDAETWLAAQDEAQRLRDLWWVFSDVMCNILCADPETVPDKAAAIKAAVDEFKSMIETGANVMLSRVANFLDKFENSAGEVQMADNTGASTVETPAATPSHPLDAYWGVFRAAYDEAIATANTRNERLLKLQPAMTALGKAVQRSVADQTPLQTEDIESVISRLLDEKIAKLVPTAPAAAKTEAPVEPSVTQSKATARQVTPAEVVQAQSRAATPSKGARVSDIVRATTYGPGGAK